MKFVEETTALCQECEADKICKAHIVEKEGEEFLRIFCKQCGESLIKIVDKNKKKAISWWAIGAKIKGLFKKKFYKNMTIWSTILAILLGLIIWCVLLFVFQKFNILWF